MHLLSHSTGENRILSYNLADFNQTTKKSTRGYDTPVAPTFQTNLNPDGSTRNLSNVLPGQDTPLPSQTVSSNPTVFTNTGYSATGQSPDYNINLDPTYFGERSKELTGWTGTPSSTGNMGLQPAQTPQDRIRAAGEAAVNASRFGAGASTEQIQAARTAAEQAMAAQIQAEQQAQTKATSDATRRMGESSGATQPTQNSLSSFTAGRLHTRLGAITGDRQTYIEKRRAEGASDIMIRDELAKGAVQSPTTPTNVPPQTGGTTTDGGTNTAGGATGGTQTPPPQSTNTQKGTDTTNSNVPPPTVIPPVAQSIGDQMYQIGVANGDPMAGITKALYDDMILREATEKQNALLSLNASIIGAEQSNTDTQSYIDKWVNIATTNSDKLTGLLQTQNEETNKVLEQQKSNALQKLEFDKQVQTQQLEKQKAQDVLKSSIAIALRGGSYSGAAQEALASSEREWDLGIQNMAKEFSFKAADVTMDFTSKYVTAKQNLALNLFNASETLSNKIEGYANAGFSSLQAKNKAVTEAKNTYRTTIDTIVKDHATYNQTLVKEMEVRVNKKRDDEAKKQDSLWDRLYDHYGTFGGNNPDMEKALKKQMQDAGIDTSLIPEGIATASEVANYMRQSLEVKKVRPLTSGFTKEFNEIDEGLTLLNDFEQRIEADDFNTIFGTDARGPIGGRVGKLNPWSATNRFMASSKVIKQIIGKALEGGVLRKEDEAKYQHIIPNETDGNEVLTEKFDNLRKILKNSRAIKLNNLRRSGYDVSEYSDIDPLYMEEHNLNDTDAQRILEGLSSGNFEGGEYVSMLTTVGGGITQSFDTPVSSVKYGGLYEDSTVEAWGGRHRGVDIDMKVGTEIPAPNDLTIKNVLGSASSKTGWGLNVLAVDSSGLEYRFSHLSDAKVKKGQTIKKGSLIALSGDSGNSTGPHLDYRVRKNGTYIDPFSLTL